MNTFVIALAAAVALLSQSASAACISNNLYTSPVLLPSPVISTCVTPVVPTLSSTTVVTNCNSVTNKMVDILQMLPVCNLLADQLPYCSNLYGLPLANPVFSAPYFNTCGCGCGYPIIF